MSSISKYFYGATLYHALVASIVTMLIAVPSLEIPKIIAGAGAGIWFTVGYIIYIIIGPIGNASFTYLFGGANGELKGLLKGLGLAHFAMFNIGLVGTTYMLMYAGYNAGYMQHIVPNLTGGQPNFGAIHEFLVVFVEPIGISLILAALGAVIGVVVLLANIRKISL